MGTTSIPFSPPHFPSSLLIPPHPSLCTCPLSCTCIPAGVLCTVASCLPATATTHTCLPACCCLPSPAHLCWNIVSSTPCLPYSHALLEPDLTPLFSFSVWTVGWMYRLTGETTKEKGQCAIPPFPAHLYTTPPDVSPSLWWMGGTSNISLYKSFWRTDVFCLLGWRIRTGCFCLLHTLPCLAACTCLCLTRYAIHTSPFFPPCPLIAMPFARLSPLPCLPPCLACHHPAFLPAASHCLPACALILVGGSSWEFLPCLLPHLPAFACHALCFLPIALPASLATRLRAHLPAAPCLCL